MSTGQRGLMHEELTRRIIGVFYEVYTELGFGFLESVYEAAMEIALRDAGLMVERQVRVPVYFRGQLVGEFVPDMLVERLVQVELKAIRALDSSSESQCLNALRATSVEVGLLLNFGPKPEFRRFIFDNPRKAPRGNAFDPRTRQ
jgi:GxxExxY protein